MKVYLAGPISGHSNYAERFAEYADNLRADGHSVFNPAAANQEGRPLNLIMAFVLPQLCECEAIALMPGWRGSDGAQIEWRLAEYLKLKIIFL